LPGSSVSSDHGSILSGRGPIISEHGSIHSERGSIHSERGSVHSGRGGSVNSGRGESVHSGRGGSVHSGRGSVHSGLAEHSDSDDSIFVRAPKRSRAERELEELRLNAQSLGALSEPQVKNII